MQQRSSSLLTMLFLLVFPFYPHGFVIDTLIESESYPRPSSINDILLNINKKDSIYLGSLDVQRCKFMYKPIVAVFSGMSSLSCHLSFDHNPLHDIVCSPDQSFYRISDNTWIVASLLKVGDILSASSISDFVASSSAACGGV